MRAKSIILFLLFVSTLNVFAQQGLMMPIPEQDSSQMLMGRQLEYRQLVAGNVPGYFAPETIKLPGFDFQKEYLSRYAFSFNMASLGGLPATGFSLGSMTPFYPGFYQNGMILSEGAYNISDKFTFGGYSYGANSVMSAPLPNQGMNKFDNYGSTLFMQYKVTKNFKIETRVNVSKGGGYPGF